MTFDVKRGVTWAAVWFALWVPGHLFLMPWLAERYPTFERWNYSNHETWVMGLTTVIIGGLIFAVWKPKT